MRIASKKSWFKGIRPAVVVFACLSVFSGYLGNFQYAGATDAPVPLLEKGHPVDWWFVYKFNSQFRGCGGNAKRQCPFGGKAQAYPSFGQQFVYASSENSSLQKGSGCAGATTTDPLGVTFDQIYNGPYFYVVWNDQFYGDPKITGPKCTATQCGGPWGHSKGMLAWNESGEGLVLQVSTPSWPASGSKDFPRKSGNTLGCVSNDNNVKVAQHFFALKLNKEDVIEVLTALQNSSVVTKQDEEKIVRNGGPADVQKLVADLGKKSNNTDYTKTTLSSGVALISKPSDLNVPPWQMVSSLLGGISLRTATWWARPRIYTTQAGKTPACWDDRLNQKPGRVEIATTGEWEDKTLSLISGSNHAKLGVSISGTNHYAIFGDLNQQGAISGTCESSQNGRGGMFFVLDNKTLSDDLTKMIDGETAPLKAPPKKPK